MSFVSIQGLTVAFDGTQVVHGIDLEIERGEALGLVGESGCGKSVTWLAALGLLPGQGECWRLGQDRWTGVDRRLPPTGGAGAGQADCDDLPGSVLVP